MTLRPAQDKTKTLRTNHEQRTDYDTANRLRADRLRTDRLRTDRLRTDRLRHCKLTMNCEQTTTHVSSTTGLQVLDDRTHTHRTRRSVLIYRTSQVAQITNNKFTPIRLQRPSVISLAQTCCETNHQSTHAARTLPATNCHDGCRSLQSQFQKLVGQVIYTIRREWWKLSKIALDI